MAVHLWFGRILSVSLLVLFGLAGTARADHVLTHPAATQQAVAAERDAKRLFEKWKEAKVRRDASIYITARNIPKDDLFLGAYSTDRAVEGISAPGLLGIAAQAYRVQGAAGTTNKAYSLADAMRDAVWRKKTAAMLESLTTTQSACARGAGDTSWGTPSVGLGAIC